MLRPCAAEPLVPAPGATVTDPTTGEQRQVTSDEQATSYMIGLRAAGQDCRSRVEWFRAWFAALPD